MDFFEAEKELRKLLASYDDMVNLNQWTYRRYEEAIDMLRDAGASRMCIDMRIDEVNR